MTDFDACEWKQDDDGVYNTDCDHRFEFTAEGPRENGFLFCPYCGYPID